MVHLVGSERAQYVQGMFARIASRYDLMNRLMTFGRDRRWRNEVVQRAHLPRAGGLLLDLGGGTGDLGIAACRYNPATVTVEVDFTLEMMQVGRQRQGNYPLHWSSADALLLPFPDETFDAVVSGFLLRNVVDLPKVLSEQHRVLKDGGRFVALDTTRLQKNIVSPVVSTYMQRILPIMGRVITGQKDAYLYLPETSAAFLPAEELVAYLAAAGFGKIGFERLDFGAVAIHWGEK
jgi:demethylmenaquinone methyltransferase/2-methoxy-6-polyprenyl-1,4-benzoquinol methylase